MKQDQNINQKVDRLYDLERSIALITLDAEQRRNQTYKSFKISELNAEYPGVRLF